MFASVSLNSHCLILAELCLSWLEPRFGLWQRCLVMGPGLSCQLIVRSWYSSVDSQCSTECIAECSLKFLTYLGRHLRRFCSCGLDWLHRDITGGDVRRLELDFDQLFSLSRGLSPENRYLTVTMQGFEFCFWNHRRIFELLSDAFSVRPLFLDVVFNVLYNPYSRDHCDGHHQVSLILDIWQ